MEFSCCPLPVSEDTMPGMSRLLACRLMPCASMPVMLDLCTSREAEAGAGTELWSPPSDAASSEAHPASDPAGGISELSACVMVNSGRLTTVVETEDDDAEAEGMELEQSTGPQTVAFWHLAMHFLWQHMEHSWHCMASFSQIFLPQKSHWVARWKCVLTKLCARGATAALELEVEPTDMKLSEKVLVDLREAVSQE